MTTFTFPGKPLDRDTPLNQFHVWEWARSVPRKEATLKNYLDAVGFKVGTDQLTEVQYDVLRAAFEQFFRVEPILPDTFKFADIFKPVGLGEIGYYVQGAPGRSGERYELHGPGLRFTEILVEEGWVKSTRPHETYFQLVNGVLWARYQTILGQRPVCRVEL